MRRFVLAVLAVLVVGCSGPAGLPGSATLEVTAVAGPMCPVERDPPDPACAPRAVPDAVMILTDVNGREVARGVTDADGQLTLTFAPGDRVLVPQPVEGLLGTAGTAQLSIADGQLLELQVDYDTGIR